MKKTPLPIYFLDTETLGFGGRAICLTSVGLNDVEAKAFVGFDCIEDGINSIVDENPQADIIRVYFHNAGFDLMRFKDQLDGCVVSIQQNGTMFISGAIAYRNKILVIRDSLALLPSSLKKLSQSFCPELPKMELDFTENDFDITDEYHLDYAKRDVIALRLIVTRFAEVLGVKVDKLAITAASQSFKLMKKSISDNFGEYRPSTRKENDDYRKYYFGGRIYIRDGHCIDSNFETVSIDITSSYPQQMRGFIYPKAGKSPKIAHGVIPSPAFKGRFLVTVKVTNYRAELPLLPVRVNDAPVYPHGSFESHITDHEYTLLTETKEYDSLEIGRVLWWSCNECDYIFKPYVTEAYKLKLKGDVLNKQEKGSGEALRTVGKLNLNSPYGKLAQRYLDEQDSGLIGWGDDYENLSPFGKEMNSTPNDHRNVHLAAMITASGRCQLYRAIRYYGAQNVIYCDTDSVKVLKEVYDKLPTYHEIGEDLGQWKPEGIYHELRVIAPKVYVANVEEGGKFHNEVKSKGTPPNMITHFESDGILFKPKKTGNKEKDKALCSDMFYALMQSHKHTLVISYGEKPTRLKTYINTGIMAHKSHKTVTNPCMVKAMRFDAINRTYHTLTVNDL
jgi:hypothetical protein